MAQSFDLPYSVRLDQSGKDGHQEVNIKFNIAEDFDNYILETGETNRSISIGVNGLIIYKVNSSLFAEIKTNYPIVPTDQGLTIMNKAQ